MISLFSALIALAMSALIFSASTAFSAESAFAVTSDAFAKIRAQYVDDIDDAKVLRAAIKGLGAIRGAGARDNNTRSRQANPKHDQLLGELKAAFNQARNRAPNVDDEGLAAAAINGMIGALDSQTGYVDARTWREYQALGGQGGVGLSLTMRDGDAIVVGAIADSPAEKAGIIAGDVVAAIDHVAVPGMTLNEVVAKLRGALDSQIVLTLIRSGSDRSVDIELTRKPIRARHVQARLIDGVGYIALTGFGEQTPSDLKAAIAKLGSEDLVLDLRENPGGLLDSAMATTGLFLDKKLIATIRARKSERQRFESDASGITKGRLVVLVNENIASGAEVMAGTLQDYRRAIVVGMQSMGAGTVQTTVLVGEGNSALRLTTSRIHMSTGRALEGNGVKPNIVVRNTPRSDGTMQSRDDKDAQLQAAINALKRDRR